MIQISICVVIAIVFVWVLNNTGGGSNASGCCPTGA